MYYLYRNEVAAFQWLEENANSNSVILTDSQTGLYIPGWTGMKILYGHPFETPYAEENKQLVDRCMADIRHPDCLDILTSEKIDYVLVSSRNSDNFYAFEDTNLPLCYDSTMVKIYEVIP